MDSKNEISAIDPRFISATDKRKITSKANAEKARLTKLAKAKKLEEPEPEPEPPKQESKPKTKPKYKYDSDSDKSDSSESDEEIVYKAVKKNTKAKKPTNKNDELLDRIAYLESLVKSQNKTDKHEIVEKPQQKPQSSNIIDNEIKKKAIYRVLNFDN